MVVAGRVTDDGDVAIMMVEAEATEQHHRRWSRAAPPAPTEEVVAEGLEAAKPFIKQLCEAQAELAAQAAKPVRRVPGLPRLRGRRLRRRRGRRRRPSSPQALTIAGKQEREDALDAHQGRGRSRQLGRPVRGPREGDRRGVPLADQEARSAQRVLRDKVRIDGRGLTDIRTAVRRGRACSRGCTARRCSSAARPRSWASPR